MFFKQAPITYPLMRVGPLSQSVTVSALPRCRTSEGPCAYVNNLDISCLFARSFWGPKLTSSQSHVRQLRLGGTKDDARYHRGLIMRFNTRLASRAVVDNSTLLACKRQNPLAIMKQMINCTLQCLTLTKKGSMLTVEKSDR